MLLCCLQEECRYSKQVKGSCEALSQQVAVLEDSLGTANSAHRAAEAKLSPLGARLQVCLAFVIVLSVAPFPQNCLPAHACAAKQQMEMAHATPMLAPVAYQHRRAMQSDGLGAF